jgi:hypothetical protein
MHACMCVWGHSAYIFSTYIITNMHSKESAPMTWMLTTLICLAGITLLVVISIND